MKLEDFIEYLLNNGCYIHADRDTYYVLKRHDNHNVQSGTPKVEIVKKTLVCRICRTLQVDIPQECLVGAAIIDELVKRHPVNK